MVMKPQTIAKISAVVALVVAAAVSIGYVLERDRPLGEGYKQVSEYGGDFTLTTDKGKQSLSDFKGKVVVLYFGFMSCQDACPISLGKLRVVAKRLTPEERKNFQGALITIDPPRDNPEDLGAFMRNYHPDFIGFTGTQAEIDKVSAQYGVYAKPEDFNGESATYTVDHSSRFYMIDKNGKLVTTMSHSTTPAELVAKIRTLM